LRFILHERGLSKNTHKGYQAMLRHFLNWLKKNGYPEPITDCLTVPVCRRFLYYLSGRGLRPRTIHSYFDPLDGLCTFSGGERRAEGEPCQAVDIAGERSCTTGHRL
jgi:site-specific recombinase XerD